jgi:antitoxin StbD
MDPIYASLAVSISELKKNPTALLHKADSQAIAILNHNRPVAYIVPAELYEKIVDALENDELVSIAKLRLHEKPKAIKVIAR